MKRFSLWIKLALLLCAVITAVSATQTSLAYIAARSNTLHNSFYVVYTSAQDIIVPVTIRKSVVNLTDEEIGPGGFDFHLINIETGEAVIATSSDDGLAMMYLNFTAEDVGKTYRYRLYEMNDGREDVVFDNTVYEISIAITLNDMHELSADLTMNGQSVQELTAEYVNEYYSYIPIPDTGDDARPLLWVAMMIFSGAGIVALVKKSAVFRRI